MPQPASASAHAAKPSTKEALLDAAEALFGERGYEAVGIRQIVERAGANLAAIKYHFGSKQELYNETVRRLLARANAVENIWAPLEGPFTGPEEAAETLGVFIGRHCQRVLEGGASTVAARLFLMEAIWPSECFDDVIEEHFKPSLKRLERTVRAINPRIPEEEAATVANSVIAPMAYQRIYRRIIDSIEDGSAPAEGHALRLARTISAFVIRGIGADAALVGVAQAACERAIDSSARRDRAQPHDEARQP